MIITAVTMVKLSVEAPASISAS